MNGTMVSDGGSNGADPIGGSAKPSTSIAGISNADVRLQIKDGTVIEETSVEAFASPTTLRHPFTRALWHALPEHGFSAPAIALDPAPAEGGEAPC